MKDKIKIKEYSDMMDSQITAFIDLLSDKRGISERVLLLFISLINTDGLVKDYLKNQERIDKIRDEIFLTVKQEKDVEVIDEVN